MKEFCLLPIFIFFNFIGFGDEQRAFEEGRLLLESGEISKAKTLFLNYPNNNKAQEFLGDIASFEQNWDDAVKYYMKLAEGDPGNANYNFKYGGALGMKAMNISKFQAVILIGDIKKYLNKAAVLDKNHAEVRRALVELYIQLPGILGGSRKIAKEFAEELQPINRVDAYLAKSYLLKYDNKPEEAKIEAKKAIAQALKNENLLTRNYLYYELGKTSAEYAVFPEEGMKFLEAYVKNYGYKDLKPPAWAYYHMAQIQANENNKKEALPLIEYALRQKPNFEEAKKEKERIKDL